MKEIKLLLLLITLTFTFNACSKDEDKDSEVWKNETVKMFDNTTIECIDNIKQGIVKIKFTSQWNPQESDALFIEDYKTKGYENDTYFYIFGKVDVLGDVLKVGLSLSNPWRTEYVYFEIINENTLKANGHTYKKYKN